MKYFKASIHPTPNAKRQTTNNKQQTTNHKHFIYEKAPFCSTRFISNSKRPSTILCSYKWVGGLLSI
jgi:hypothetical protein